MVSAMEGVVYDPAADRWGEMPAGMLAGWRGPAASMAEETVYVVNEAAGVLRRYDGEGDAWRDVAKSGLMRGAQKVAAGGGRVCVLCGGGEKILVVDVAGRPPARMWVEDVPPGIQVVGIHILPRLVSS
ncbi:F-box/kelch-repeat protein SKIP25 [Striga hermonthica]|uniref:F-box/kelch-repeat protein SKIP25 n=1 Tax=Striga hermonthica TaxID=68872 RepID=A0A9N7RDW4_STRHE|nr:F-box/kelch-repeat protein SKIP25 [Striga hermonthica]